MGSPGSLVFSKTNLHTLGLRGTPRIMVDPDSDVDRGSVLFTFLDIGRQAFLTICCHSRGDVAAALAD